MMIKPIKIMRETTTLTAGISTIIIMIIIILVAVIIIIIMTITDINSSNEDTPRKLGVSRKDRHLAAGRHPRHRASERRYD